MRWALLSLALGGCAVNAAPPPKDILMPDTRLTAPATALPPLSLMAQGNEEMWSAYGQCRVQHADVADRHAGLVGYVKAIRKQ